MGINNDKIKDKGKTMEINNQPRNQTRKVNYRNLGILIGIAVVLTVAVFFGLKYLYDESQKYIEVEPLPVDQLPRHNYDYQYLKDVDSVFEYYDPNTEIRGIKGIDVSSHQKEIDWAKVKADGVEFAMIRVGYRGYQSGIINLDTTFHYNIQEALDNDIEVGVYFFSQAMNEEEVLDEANFVLDEIDGYDITYPVVYDLEDIHDEEHRIMDLTREERTELAIIFSGRVKREDYSPMIYTNLYWAENYYNMECILNYDIWFAQYNDLPEFEYEYQIWQYTDSGVVDGINTPVDLNVNFTYKP